LLKLFVQFLEDPGIPLGSHNNQMEQLWSRMILKADIPDNKWAWDSMIAAHILDNRSDITSLEFQVAVRYGDWSFKQATDPFLKCPGKIEENGTTRKTGGNDFNRIDDCPEGDILKRVAKDALYGRWLSFDQAAEMEKAPHPWRRGKSLVNAYWLYHDGNLSLGETALDGGLRFNEPYFEEKKISLAEELKPLKERILTSDPARVYSQVINPGKVLNPGSDNQISKILFGQYAIKPLSFTQKAERGQINFDLLTSLENHPQVGQFCKDILQYNKITKLRSTYIDGFAREAWQGIIYPHFGLNVAKTGRSNSSGPNFQNIPARDDFSRTLIRMGLFPHPGQRGVGADYGSHEFVIACCYSKDPEMIRYILEGGDPHGDQARRIFLLTKEQTTKFLRYIAKNGWVFPQQYGSWYEACAKNMWSMSENQKLPSGILTHDHLKIKGIRSLDEFIQHCRAEETIYWRKFAGLKAWQEEWIARYQREGLVPMYHGFLCQGHMSKNFILNTSIQGTGFQFLLEAFTELNKIRKEEGWKSRIIGQIHDEIRLSVDPDEFDYIVQITSWVMRDLMQQRHNDFLCVPLKVEFKVGQVDQPWATEKGFPV